MPLNFPSRPDVPLRRPPLTEVICQVRFPPILRILQDPPGDLQERVRHRFPVLEFAPGLDNNPQLFRFRTIDEHTAITFGVDSYAVTTSRYTVWDAFAQDLVTAHEAVHGVYTLPFCTRIGLRYVNLFTTSNTGTESLTEMADVLRPELVPPLETNAWRNPEEVGTHILLDNGNGKLLLRTGAKAIVEGRGPVVFLDLDYFEEGNIPVDGVVDRCRHYHDLIYDAFRWAVKEDKLVLFDPIVEEGR